MSLSLNETEAMARKAARGAGYDWGMAEEAGKAVRWLCAHGLDGVGELATLLSAGDGTDPLICGTHYADTAPASAHSPLNLRRVNAPLLFLPFAARAAARGAITLNLSWDGGRAVTDGKSTHAVQQYRATSDLTIRPTGQEFAGLQPATRATPRQEDWAKLEALAHRTYAPETEASRLGGAGAGLSDND